MEEVEVPPYFLCPISLEIMKDPVTISTGITYDRQNIENWIFSVKKTSCPVTQQPLSDNELIPNVTLRRVIQSWCTLHASLGVERFPTPRPLVSNSHISKLLREASSTPEMRAKCLQDLKSIASQNEANKRGMENAGVPEFLASIINSGVDLSQTEDALCMIHNLGLSETSLRTILGRDTMFINALVSAMQRGTYETRVCAVNLLKSMLAFAEPFQLTSLDARFFRELVLVLREKFSQKASKCVLQILTAVCHKGRNRIRAAEAGAAVALIDLLLDSTDRRCSESSLVILEQLCQCAEGRAELLKHAAGLAVVSKKILRVSQLASEKSVRILYSVSRFSGSPGVVQEMLQLGVAAKLCMILQIECGSKIKERAAEILKMHAKEWKNSQQCVPLLALIYPTQSHGR
ncbi:unnamed protein product [Cuscuta europaea]|uniref:U-box domain-containing protein n=1 Tax=Cuscuta europaea TaxID=41803 RepID=A0A9P1E5I9_CUSEU|nr:unnamed protein product [Cuscuta europaea]